MRSPSPHDAPVDDFNWPVAYGAEELVRHHLAAFLERNAVARDLARRMAAETGTDFFEWVDHFTVNPHAEAEFVARGFIWDDVPAPEGWAVLRHPRAMLPRVVITAGGLADGAPTRLALKPESLTDFVGRNSPGTSITGREGARYRIADIADENGHRLIAVERLAYRGFVFEDATPEFVRAMDAVRHLWRDRSRNFDDVVAGIAEAEKLQAKAIGLVGRDVACELFFAAERAYWEQRNATARLQKRRQDSLGLGWGNHDHHTFRCSRAGFAPLIRFLLNFGFVKRERYYAGAEAGWGAQISEHATTGITVFADVDLMPDETTIDFSVEPLLPAQKLGTVGMWCALHGDSMLQAGMHHLEARFDFEALRGQLETEGVKTMKPFSDFPFLRQAFTEGERWAVDPQRLDRLVRARLITSVQAESFRHDGAVGSHLENLQRKGGYKGFNQKSVSAIIAATDPRSLQLTHA